MSDAKSTEPPLNEMLARISSSIAEEKHPVLRMPTGVASAGAIAPDRPDGRREPHFDAGPAQSGGRTLEEVVSDMLRPMLQRWLDDNLPRLVEGTVRAELARLTGKAEAG